MSLDQEPVVSCVPHCYTQEVSLACSLRAGAYTIIPSTYQPDLRGHFTLTVARRIHRCASLSPAMHVKRMDSMESCLSVLYCENPSSVFFPCLVSIFMCIICAHYHSEQVPTPRSEDPIR